MHSLIFEHVCGGGMAGEPIPRHLAEQGGAMLRAAVEDFISAGHRVTTTRDVRMDFRMPGADVIRISADDPCAHMVTDAARRCDVAMIIAPECDRVLEGWCVRLGEAGVKTISCSPPAVRLCADKRACSEHLRRHGVPVPEQLIMNKYAGISSKIESEPSQAQDSALSGVVVKPNDGAGCADTFLVHDGGAASDVRNRGDVVVERFHRGTPVSASFLAHGDRLIELPAGRQTITNSAINRHMDRLTYAGGAIGLSSDLARRATALARRALQSIEGLRGFVGVDMVLGDSAPSAPGDPGSDGAGDVVVDINPRLTVSYIALCTLCETSLAAAMLDMDAPLAFDGRVVEFDYTGRVHGGVVT